MSEWIISGVRDGCYICDDCLKDCKKMILVTYEAANGRRYVKQVECSYGYIRKKIGGNVIAWMPLPEPYKEKIYQNEIYNDGKFTAYSIV